MNPNLILTLTLEPTEALVLIGCDEHFSDEYGFVWPSSGTVQANPLYGLLWGEGPFFGDFHTSSKWIVARVVKDLCQSKDGQRIEFPTCQVVYVGDYPSALALILAHNPNAKPISTTYLSSQDQTTQIHQGDFNHIISSGRLCSSVAVGEQVRAEAEGPGSTSIAHGPHPRAASKGKFSQGIAVGFDGASSAEGPDSLSVSSGDGGTSIAVGKDCISVACGQNADSRATSLGSNSVALGKYGSSFSRGQNLKT